MLSLPYHFVSCPGLFYSTFAGDGILSRIRVPGGILNSQQFRTVANLATEFGGGSVHVTNRANLQVRQIHTEIPARVLTSLQQIGIAANNPEVDHLRNIMGSPTAGIDPDELIDTRPLIRELDNYIATHPELTPLSPKFSIAIDGGGCVSICDRPNDITLSALLWNTNVYFRLKLNLGTSPEEPLMTSDVLLKPEECLEVVAALAKVYLHHLTLETRNIIPHRRSSQPRLREVVNHLGSDKFLQEVELHLPYSLRRVSLEKETEGSGQYDSDKRKLETRFLKETGFLEPQLSSTKQYGGSQENWRNSSYQHIGVHLQKQQGLSYIGVVLPLGLLESWQMHELADIAQTYGSGTLRLTPWQNLLLSDIPNQYIQKVKSQIEKLGLHWEATDIRSALVACTGNTGCASSATDTKAHAKALVEYLSKRVTLNQPVNIHLTGCEKSCAQHSRSDIALLGVTIQQEGKTMQGYKVYVGDGNETFGRELYHSVPFPELPPLLDIMLQTYLTKRTNNNESFGQFANRYAIAELQKLFKEVVNGYSIP
ncbi:MAG: precorrin-3B synthase [Scytonema sp. PMC 1069.18]|nr:precorrin-3B synthase [Scytonema sp. PMC 1069.18]MEC4887373.1 precorrin-3B synthase [Scytonema sp. PMC 1070.18]